MISIINFIIGIAFLIILSWIDFNTFNKEDKGIPAFLTSIFLIICFISNPTNIISGVLAFFMALMFTDLELWAGIADFKVYVAVGFLLPYFNVLLFGLLLTLFGILFKYIWRKEKYIPFLPVMALSFVIASMVF